MTIELNHTIIAARDAEASARWFADLFDMPEPEHLFGYFWQVSTANGVGLDFESVDDAHIHGTHYAFLVGEADFDAIYGRIVERGIEHWADPGARRAGEINRNDGGRGVYFRSNDGHFLEIITRPYGSGG
jgi:catechol 2,3-dioxygenase-like lactoylglutathione lyase family enzyme